MELTKLLFNNLTVSSNNMKTGLDNSAKTENKFENYLNNASSTKNSDKVSSKNDAKNNVSKNDAKSSDKTVKSTDKKANEKVLDRKNESDSTADSTDDSNKKVDDGKDVNVSDEKENVLSEKETELQESIADILGVEVDEVKNALEQLGISVFELNNPRKLLDFLQEVFQADIPSDLLAVDGIKDMMVQIKQVIEEKTDGFEDLIQNFLDKSSEQVTEKNLTYEKNVSVSEETDVVSDSGEEVSGMEEKGFNQGVVSDGNEKNSPNNKNKDEFSTVKNESVQTEEIAPVKANEGMNMQNGFNQQGFQNNNMNFENNSSLNNVNGLNAVTFDNINKAFSRVVAKNETMRNVNTADVINQIIDKFKAGVVKENISQIKITLKPDYLGDVSLKIVSENGIVSAQFTAENQRVKEIIESNFNNLKNMLDEQGVQVSALSVSVGGEDTENERNRFGFEQSKSSKRISNIIDNSSEETEEESTSYIDEGDVLQTSVNYTA